WPTCYLTTSRSRTAAPGQPFEFFLQALQLIIREVLQVHQIQARPSCGSNQLVEFQLQRASVAILRVLQKKRDEEGDLGGGRVHRQLPGVGEMKCRPY